MEALSLGLSAPPAIPGPLLLSDRSVYFGRSCLMGVAEYCLNNGFVIMGLEGFVTDGSSITPVTDFIVDLSEIDGTFENRVQASFDAAITIIRQWSELPGFDFVEFEVVEKDGQ